MTFITVAMHRCVRMGQVYRLYIRTKAGKGHIDLSLESTGPGTVYAPVSLPQYIYIIICPLIRT